MTGICGLAARELRRRGLAPPPAFTGFPPPPDTMPPEWAGGYRRLRSVAAQEGLRLFYHTWTPGDLLRNLSEDHCLPGAGVGYPASLAAGEGVRVLLSGLGGDECVSNTGAGHDFSLLLSGRWPSLLAHLREHGRRPAHEIPKMLAGLLHPNLAPASRFWKLLREGRLRAESDRWQLRNYWLINAQFARRSPPMAVPAVRMLSVRRRQLHRLRRGHLSQRMEAEVAGGARCGLEYRHPLLDRRLVEFALSRPPEAPLTRAGCVDMPRLLERLGDVEKFRRRPRPLPILSALELLDFQNAA